QSMSDVWSKIQPLEDTELLAGDRAATRELVAEKRGRIITFRWWTGVAAGFLVLIFALVALNRDRTTTFFTTDFGERETILLPDGSTVELNANSTLSWDENWEKTGIRQVHLTG